METEIETVIDGRAFRWRAEGKFAWGSGPPLCRLERDRVSAALGPEGYRVVELPQGCAERLAETAAVLLGYRHRDQLTSYHTDVDEAGHLATVERTTRLRLKEFAVAPGCLAGLFGAILGIPLSETVAALGRDYVILRINRPHSTDYNPPHRDGSLAVWARSVNIWIPVAGVDRQTSLPLFPGSHRVAESECLQTGPGGVAIAGRRYHVPAIACLRSGALRMTRASVAFGQALMFTPYLIHGLAVNESRQTRMSLELRLEVVDA
jgi:hypothetical protein